MEPSLLQTVFLQNDAEMLSMIDRQSGWVAEVTGSRTTQRNDSGEFATRRQVLQRALDRAEEQLNRAQTDKKEKAVDKAARLVASLETKLAALGTETVGQEAVGSGIDERTQESLIRAAYLRTLTREPEEDELNRARSAFASSSPREAIRDLMWALLNTKEFVLNH
jgi:hypothetical protein